MGKYAGRLKSASFTAYGSGADVGAKIDEWLAWRAEEKMPEVEILKIDFTSYEAFVYALGPQTHVTALIFYREVA
jgi:hypothetical protein